MSAWAYVADGYLHGLLLRSHLHQILTHAQRTKMPPATARVDSEGLSPPPAYPHFLPDPKCLAPDCSLNRAVGALWGVGDLILLPSLPALSLHRRGPDKGRRKLQQDGFKDDSRSNSQIWSSGRKRDRLGSMEPVHLVRET